MTPFSPLKKMLIAAFVLAILSASAYFYVAFYKDKAKIKELNAFSAIRSQSSQGANTEALQNYLLQSVKDNKNDKFTRAAVYFAINRYIENNGDIYEVYTYVNSHPELAFLKKAETISPDIFARIASGKVSKTYNYASMTAYLAYLEAADTAGYSDIATLGTLANKHADLASSYKAVTMASSTSQENKVKYQKAYDESLRKSLLFFSKATPVVENIMKDDAGLLDGDIYPADVVVGLNNYAHSMQYYKALGVKFSSQRSADKVFSFSADYSFKNAPTFYVFTNYYYATSLVVSREATKDTVMKPLATVVAYMNPLDIKTNYTITSRIVKAKENNLKGAYDVQKIVTLANLNKDFKNFLLANGWTEGDFGKVAPVVTKPVKK